MDHMDPITTRLDTIPNLRLSGAWRRVVYWISYVRDDDPPHRCLRCSQTVRVGQRVVTRRSAHEQTPHAYGPIEDMVHWSCWLTLELTNPGVLPLLGKKGIRYERYGDYPWSPVW